MVPRVVIVAIGGPTSSGKTTLAKHLARVLPSTTLSLFQDDFAPPSELVPFDEVNGWQDWDDAAGAFVLLLPFLHFPLAYPNRRITFPPSFSAVQNPVGSATRSSAAVERDGQFSRVTFFSRPPKRSNTGPDQRGGHHFMAEEV
jgi:energy-coupling factor transporter ATP-binding protein EcfA2